MFKHNKQTHIQQLHQEAEEASKGLTSVYQVVRRLAPKTTHKPIQFRDDAGTPLTTVQEPQKIREYFTELYKSSEPEPNPPADVCETFTFEEVINTLMQLPRVKRSPLGFFLLHRGHWRLAT